MSVLDLVERIARDELVELLGDVTPPPADPPVLVRGTEEQLAAQLAAEHHGECWETFAAGAVSEAFAGRALDLYHASAPWLPDDDGPAEVRPRCCARSATATRCSRIPSTRTRCRCPLKVFAEVVMRALGIDAWAAALGHPLELDAAEADYQLEHHQDPDTDDRDPDADLAGAVDTATRQFELLEVLCDSPTGRTALQSEGFRRFAVEQIVAGHAWSFWVRPNRRAKPPNGSCGSPKRGSSPPTAQ